MTDYITEAGTIHWDRAEKFIELLGNHEKQVFQGRIDEIDYQRQRKGGGGQSARGGEDAKNDRNRDLTKTVTVSQEAQMLLEGEVGEGGDDRGALSA